MTTEPDRLKLAERCEKATGPDRELDALIAVGIGWTRHGAPYHGWFEPGDDLGSRYADPPKFTESIDAAMTLVPEDWCVSLQGVNDSWHVALNATKFGPLRQSFGFAQAFALALCAAALRARAAVYALEGLRAQARRVRNYSDPDDVFEAVPLRFFDERESDNG